MKAMRRWVIQRKSDGKYYSGADSEERWSDDIHVALRTGFNMQTCTWSDSTWPTRKETPAQKGERAVPVLVTIERINKVRKGGAE